MIPSLAKTFLRILTGGTLLIAFVPSAAADSWTCTYSKCFDQLSCFNAMPTPVCACTGLDGGGLGVIYQDAVAENSACGEPFTGTTSQQVASAVSTGTATSTGTTSAVSSVVQSLASTNAPVVDSVSAKGSSASGAQMSAIASAREINDLGANQAATVAAIFCAEGANAQLTNDADAAAFYANCKQNFGAANLMKPQGGFTAHDATLSAPASQSALSDFQQNFGISPAAYLQHMLGGAGGAARLEELVTDKISSEKLAAAMESADKVAPADLAANPSQFAIELGKAKPAASVSALRESLRKRLASGATEDEERAPASASAQPEKYEDLTPATDGVFALQDDASLTIFDVVHLRYSEIRKRWRR